MLKHLIHLFLLGICCLTATPICAQQPHVSKGKLIFIDSFPSHYISARSIAIWLPETDMAKPLNVLYMHDGKALFDSSIMWNHQEWGVDETMSNLIAKGEIEPTMVVGIWNGGKMRHAEFMPQQPFELMSLAQQQQFLNEKRKDGSFIFNERPAADKYLRFITQELKPYIDSLYPTLKDRAHTFMAGASMGGMISLYGLCEYPEIFGGAACLSTHWTVLYRSENNPFPNFMEDYLNKKLPDPSSHLLYFDHGDQTLDSLYAVFQERIDTMSRAKGYQPLNFMSRAYVGKEHSENAWRERFAIPLTFLLKKQ